MNNPSPNIRITFERNLSKLLQSFVGRQIDQNLIAEIWASTHDEIRNFCEEQLQIHDQNAVNWFHAIFISKAVKVGELSFEKLTTHSDAPTADKISLFDLETFSKVFQNTIVESYIVTEIQRKLGSEDGKTDEQITRSDLWSSN